MPARSLILMRHASASESQRDHDRSLSEKGAGEARIAGEHLALNPLDLVLCSTAVRALETWKLAQGAFTEPPPVAQDPALYLAGPVTLLDCITQAPDTARHVLIVAHNPGLHELAWELARGSPFQAKLSAGFRPASLVKLHVHADTWAEVTAAALEVRDIWTTAESPIST